MVEIKPNKKYKPEFVRLAFKYWFVGEEVDGEQRAFCPVCEDPQTSKSPSASFNADSGIFNCLKGDHGSSIYRLAQQLKQERGWDPRAAAMRARHNDEEFKANLENSLRSAGKRTSPLPSAEDIRAWTKRLLGNKAALGKFQEKRGITEQTIKELNLGWDGYRYTIPIYDKDGELLNVRRYKIDAASSNDKMINIPGHGSAAVYGQDDLAKYKTILITEGETDRILVRQELNTDRNNDIGVVTHTAGAKTFRQEWGPLFSGKIVYVGYDNDDVGRQGASKAVRILSPFVEAVYKVAVPIDSPGADWTDYIHKEGYGREDILRILEEAKPSTRGNTAVGPVPSFGEKVSLGETTAERNQKKTLEFVVSIAGRQIEPYAATHKIHLSCTQDKGVACATCPMNAAQGEMDIEIPPNNKELFRFVDAGEERRNKTIRELSGARCADRLSFSDEEYYTVEELVVQPSVDERSDDESQRPTTRTIFSLSTHNSGVNDKVRIVGHNVVDPRTSKVRFLSWINEKVDLDIDNFSLTAEEVDRLRSLYCPEEDQTPLDKCIEIARDMAENVTHIRGRDLLHVGYDLVWHSVLSFSIYQVDVAKGWLEAMVVGDTRTGKSEIANRLIRHYRSGALTSLEGASFAGVVGGVQQIDGRWHLTWGIVPMNDRRLVVLDEASGMKDSNLIEQMSSVRSSGVAQISKIANESTSARTRMIWITNPADGSMLRDSPDVGMSALRSVVPSNEDIARFDFVMAAAKDEVPDSVINRTFQEANNPTYTSRDSELLVKWVWSLGKSDIYISRGAANHAIKSASEMGKRYVADPPLIQSENVRYKILRVACALAGRTFSYDKGKLVVRLEHVKDAVRFLDEIYAQESMGYARKSRRIRNARKQSSANKAEIVKWLTEEEPAALDTLVAVGGSTFRMRDFQEFGAMDVDSARAAVNKLVHKKMARRKSRGDIVMEPVLVQILKELEDADDSD